MLIENPPKIIRYFLNKNFVWDVPNKNNEVFLTFDDGPTPDITTRVLDLLESYSAKATFFCIGRNAEKNIGIFEEILLRGHAIGNHTYSHLNGWNVPLSEYLEDVELARTIIKSNLFRPPYGKITKKQAEKLQKQYKIIMWDGLSRDYNANLSAEKCYTYATKKAKPGSIIVFHDSMKASHNLFKTLPSVLEYFKNKGFKFSKIE